MLTVLPRMTENMLLPRDRKGSAGVPRSLAPQAALAKTGLGGVRKGARPPKARSRRPQVLKLVPEHVGVEPQLRHARMCWVPSKRGEPEEPGSVRPAPGLKEVPYWMLGSQPLLALGSVPKSW